MILFNSPKIDSFTLLIPINNVEIVSPIFTAEYEKYYKKSGLVVNAIEDDDDENKIGFYEKYYKTENKTTQTFLKYKKVSETIGFDKETKKPIKDDFIQIMLTSKLALENYFEGINETTLIEIYNYIIYDNIINLSYDDLLDAKVTDIDICKDFRTTLNEFKDLKTFLLDYVIQPKKHLLTSSKINAKDTYGIQYNERVKATASKPFIKLYNKTLELHSDEKKRAFKNANLMHLDEQIMHGISRIEVTIKNNSHKNKLGIEYVKTLRHLISLTTSKLDEIYNSIISEYYNPVIKKQVKNTEKMAPIDTILANYMAYILNNNENITSFELIQIACENVNDSQDRYRIKKKCEEIISKVGFNKSIKRNDLKKETAVKIMQDLNIFLRDEK